MKKKQTTSQHGEMAEIKRKAACFAQSRLCATRKEKENRQKKRLYKEEYIMVGFTVTDSDPQQPLCFLCGEAPIVGGQDC